MAQWQVGLRCLAIAMLSMAAAAETGLRAAEEPAQPSPKRPATSQPAPSPSTPSPPSRSSSEPQDSARPTPVNPSPAVPSPSGQPASPPIPSTVSPSKPAPATSSPDASIEQWISDLNSDQFVVREAATKRLIATGTPAVEPLADAVLRGSLEVVIRGVHVLRELGLSEDLDTQDIARSALERIGATPQSASSRRANLALASMTDLRQSRAIDELIRLGAKIGVSQVQIGFQAADNVSTIEIGAGWEGTVKDLRRLKWLSDIRHVKLAGPLVTNEWLAQLSGMSNLNRLTLKRVSVTSVGMAQLRNMPNLHEVTVMYTPIDDGSIDHLTTLKHLNLVKLFGTKVTKEAADKLQNDLAAAKIDYREGAFLGVNCQPHPLGCEVMFVQNKSAAEDAGIESGDIILQYAGKRVETFEALTASISQNRPGEKVPVEVARDVRVRRAPFTYDSDMPLGAVTEAHPMGCRITKVDPGSVAEQMELKPGDVIVGFNEEAARNPETLATLLKGAKSGDEVSLDYARAPKLVTKVVTLGEWE